MLHDYCKTPLSAVPNYQVKYSHGGDTLVETFCTHCNIVVWVEIPKEVVESIKEKWLEKQWRSLS